MSPLAWLAVLAAVVVLVWPGSAAGQAVASVGAGTVSILRGGST